MNVRRYPRSLAEAFPNTPEYADPFGGCMKQSTRSRLFRYLLRLVIAAALLLFIFATLLGVHGVHVV